VSNAGAPGRSKQPLIPHTRGWGLALAFCTACISGAAVYVNAYLVVQNDAATVYTLNLYWTARVVRGSPAPADDVSELGWFAADELPAEDELAFHIADVLRTWRAAYL
jgi:hypothetical protein